MEIWGWAAELKKPRHQEAKTWKKWLLEADERDLAGQPETCYNWLTFDHSIRLQVVFTFHYKNFGTCVSSLDEVVKASNTVIS